MTIPDPKTEKIDAALQQAATYHTAGKLQEAERLYRNLLQTDPRNPDANHNLGVLAMQLKNSPALALPYFKVALETQPMHSQYWTSYIRALIIGGDITTAERVYTEGCLRGLRGPTVEALSARMAAAKVPPSIEIVSATRLAEREFWSEGALGISLRRLAQDTRLSAHIAFSNRRGLPEVFNARIDTQAGPDILVFVHDDIWIDDYFFADRIIDGLKTFDVIGVAGNRRRVRNQPSWAYVDDKFTWDASANLSGSIAHGQQPFGNVSFFGTGPAECELLDGVFFSARKSTLVNRDVRFDRRFEFNFYDIDFCRSARKNGLRLGTWPICLTHQSEGVFESTDWNEKHRLYLEKWEA